MVNGSQCKISGAVGHAWEYAHAQWADDRVAALHMHGGLRMRSKWTTTWQLLTRSQIETKLIVSLCFWSPIKIKTTAKFSRYIICVFVYIIVLV